GGTGVLPAVAEPSAGARIEPDIIEEAPAAERRRDLPVIQDPKVFDAYQQGVALAGKIFAASPGIEKGMIQAAEQLIDAFVRFLEQDESQLLRLFYQDYFSAQKYLHQHSVNVMVLSLRLGLSLHYNHERLHQLGLAALFHDIGLVKYTDLINQPRRFNDADYQEIKKHPVAGKELLKPFIQEFHAEVFDVIGQEHERVDGSGYPYGLPGNEIIDSAKLVGLVDTYEAMQHSRPYREKLGCLESVKQILAAKDAFEYKFLKALIDTAGVFPLTTQVKLNTREIGIVMRQNTQMPLRPVIQMTHNSQGQPLEEPKQIDLGANFSVYILDCFAESKIRRS
ncbi:MAG: HD domain-containing phosphohydrolase, partial [Saprospiraceae bacterium]|nr:HD domain-containing phosphohydrolase [Saprospiraceae bacterium]